MHNPKLLSKEDRVELILEHYSVSDHEIFAGPDWPNFESIKSGTYLPDFVIDELLQQYVLPEPVPLSARTPKYVEFYITNVCNYGCSECRSFNNFNFKGHYSFDLDLYKKWSEIISLESFVILGGEPLLHPDLASWITGTRSLWPEASAKIDTNGSRLTKVKGLHELLIDNNFFLCINLHDSHQITQLMKDILQCFGECQEIDAQSANSRFDTRGHAVEGTCLVTKSGLLINIRPTAMFAKTPAGTTDWEKLAKCDTDVTAIYMGDSEKNHRNCGSICHVMIEGKIYKCATMATLPSFLAQNNLHWPHHLLSEYEPITLENISFEKLEHLYQTIPQCTYCDTTNSHVNISSSIKNKVRIKYLKYVPRSKNG